MELILVIFNRSIELSIEAMVLWPGTERIVAEVDTDKSWCPVREAMRYLRLQVLEIIMKVKGILLTGINEGKNR